MVVTPPQNSYFVNFFSALIKFTFCDLFFALSRCRPLTSERLNPASLFVPCKVIQDSPELWIASCGFRIPGTEFQFLSLELEFWIAIVSGIPNSLSCIPDSKDQESRFHQQKFPDTEILIPLHGVISISFHYCLF